MEASPRVLGITQAGGQGSRMDVLTRERAKPALAFAGSYKLIDFALSSFAHSHISDVWVSVAYLAASLDPYIAHGRPWDLDRTRGGYRRLVPEQGRATSESGFADGNADNLVQIAGQIRQFAPDAIVVMSADHVFRLDLRPVVREHLERGAECTIVTADVTRSQAAHKAVVTVDAAGRVTRFSYKPDRPDSTAIATEIFVYDPQTLLAELARLRIDLGHEDDDSSGLGDFGDHLLPALVRRGKTWATPITHYWRDLGRPEEYLQAHRDLLAGRVDVFDDLDQPILSRWPERPPARVGASGEVNDSLLSPGVDVRGTVHRSVLGPGTVVEAGAVVEGCVIGSGVQVGRDARVHTAIVDDGTCIGRGARVRAPPRATKVRDADIALIGIDCRIGTNAVIEPGARLEPGGSA